MGIEAAVTAELEAQRGQEEAVALWKARWAAYQRAGVEGAQGHLDQLLRQPDAEGSARREVEP